MIFSKKAKDFSENFGVSAQIRRQRISSFDKWVRASIVNSLRYRTWNSVKFVIDWSVFKGILPSFRVSDRRSGNFKSREGWIHFKWKKCWKTGNEETSQREETWLHERRSLSAGLIGCKKMRWVRIVPRMSFGIKSIGCSRSFFWGVRSRLLGLHFQVEVIPL